MSIIAAALASVEPLERSPLFERARELLMEILVPRTITSALVERYVRKAMRRGVWRRLAPETRALLLLVKKLLPVVRSPTLVTILRRVFLEIELATLRGRALLLGLLHTLAHGIHAFENLLRNTAKLLVAGLQILNHPLVAHSML